MKKNILKKTAVVVAVNLLVLLAALVLLDLLFGAVAERPERGAETIETGAPAGASLPSHLLSPYLGWVETPGTRLKDLLHQSRVDLQSEKDPDPDWLYTTNNSLGFVSERDIPLVRNGNDYVIAVMGGSVARWFALQAADAFVAELAGHPFFAGRNIVLFNAASGGYKQPQQLNLLNFLLINGAAPDMVVNIDGFNEAALAFDNMKNGSSPAYPSHSHWTHLTKGFALTGEIRRILGGFQQAADRRDRFDALARKHSYSNILSYLFSKRQERWSAEMTRQEIRYTERSGALARETSELTIKGPEFKGESGGITEIWLRASALMYDICSANGIRYFHYLQPTPHDPDPGKPFTDEERARIGADDHLWAQGVRLLYSMFKARAGELEARGIRYKDLTGLFSTTTDTLYYDICHFNQKGNELLAGAVAAHIKANLPAP